MVFSKSHGHRKRQFSRFSKTFQHMVVGASLRKINRPMQINAPAHAPALAARDQLHPPARAPALSLAAPASSPGPGPDVGTPPAAYPPGTTEGRRDGEKWVRTRELRWEPAQ